MRSTPSCCAIGTNTGMIMSIPGKPSSSANNGRNTTIDISRKTVFPPPMDWIASAIAAGTPLTVISQAKMFAPPISSITMPEVTPVRTNERAEKGDANLAIDQPCRR